MFNFNKVKQVPGNLGKYKKVYDLQRQLAGSETFYEEDGVKVVLKGGGLAGKMEVKSLEVDGREDKRLIDVLNRAMKKSQDAMVKKLQDMKDDLQGLM